MRPTLYSTAAIPQITAPRILVVDDDPIVLELAVSVLNQHGHVTIGALGSAQALALAPDSVELVITDVCMPELDGPDLAAKLWARRPDLKFIFMSGGPESQLHTRTISGDLHFLSKPFTLPSLRGLVDRVLATPVQWRQPAMFLGAQMWI